MISIRKQIEQEEYCFDIAYDDEGASLLINSNEQMLSEKLWSLLKFGTFSTRFKDIYELCLVESNVARRYRSGSASPGSVSFSAEMLRHGCQDCTYQYPRQSEMV